jgi:hypothetical protein
VAMAEYGWIIDKDYAADPVVEAPSYQNAVGIIGPRDIPAHLEGALLLGAGQRFQIRYDDPPDPDEYPEYPTVYEGRCVVDNPPGWDLTEEYFGPLWDFGTPNVGAAWIFYWHEDVKEWIQL